MVSAGLNKNTMKKINSKPLLIFVLVFVAIFVLFYIFRDFLFFSYADDHPACSLVVSLIFLAVPIYYLIKLIKEYPKMNEGDKRLSCFIFGVVAGVVLTLLSE